MSYPTYTGGSAVGIIPAGAGHVLMCKATSGVWWDHPRRCGACELGAPIIFDIIGSSPQVRGMYGAPVGSTTVKRIIPAGAGHVVWE